MAFVIVKGLQRTALFFISLLGVGEGGGAEPCRQRNKRRCCCTTLIPTQSPRLNVSADTFHKQDTEDETHRSTIHQHQLVFCNCKLFYTPSTELTLPGL